MHPAVELEKDVDLPCVEPPHAGHSRWWVAAGHIIVILLGPGVLALPYIMSSLGWVASCLAFVVFFLLTLWTAGMMADVYKVDGKRHGRYGVAVDSILGRRHAAVLITSQHANLVLANIGFQIAAVDSLSYITTAACQARGLAVGPQCWSSRLALAGLVGGIQLLLSQMRNLQAARWSSVLGSAASLVYCVIVFGLAAVHAGNWRGSVHGSDKPLMDKVFRAFNALGAIAFGLNAPIITFEVADTIREPPAVAVSMRKALRLSMCTCLVLFLSGGALGYLALGDQIGPNFLLAFEGTAPAWVLVLGSVLVALNMITGYQVCAQPSYAAVEDNLANNNSLRLPGPLSRLTARPWLLSLLVRTLYVSCTTVVSMALPFFAALLGLVGAATFFQTGVMYPILMHRAVVKPSRSMGGFMNAVLVLAAGVTLLVLVGSVAVIAMNASQFSPLKA